MNKNVPKTHKVRKGIAAVIMNVILIIFSLSCIFPIVWMVYSSLKEKRVFNHGSAEKSIIDQLHKDSQQ